MMMAKEFIQPEKSAEYPIDRPTIGQGISKQSIAINPLSRLSEGVAPVGENIQVSLGKIDHQLEDDSEKINQEYTQEQFLEQVIQQGKSKSKGRRLALLGPAGSGKTTLLQQIARTILEKTQDIPLWLPLNQLGSLSIAQYLQEKWWTESCTNSAKELGLTQKSWQDCLNSGRVWLLLDGVEEMNLEQLAALPLSPESPQTILHPLAAIAHQLQSLPENSRIILTSRNYVGGIALKILTDFDIYCPLGWRETEAIRQFSQKWFAHSSPSSPVPWQGSPSANNPQNLAKTLKNALEAFGEARLPDLLSNPFYLSLICRLWQQKYPHFPSNQNSLYQELVHQYYQEQAKQITIPGHQKQRLHRSLGKLALQVLQSEPPSPWLSQQQVTAELGEDPQLWQACLQVGWLKHIGVEAQNPQAKIYAFCDQVFLNYFAALVIEDWRFFLPDIPPASRTESYPIFARQWKQTILFWLGREDIAPQHKEDFLAALINFNDRCSPDNYYGKRAFYLAASGLAEFSKSCQLHRIVEQLVRELLEPQTLIPPTSETAEAILTQTHRPKAVQILIKYLFCNPTEKRQRDILRLLESIGEGNPYAVEVMVKSLAAQKNNLLGWQGADCLGKIAPGQGKAVEILIHCLEKSSREEQRLGAINGLEKIAKGNTKAITALVRQLTKEPSPARQRRIFAALEKIAAGQAQGISNLVQLLNSSRDLSLRRQAAETLEKIDPGNPTAIAIMLELLQIAPNEEIRQQLVYHLGEIPPGNPEVIVALVNLIQSSQHIFTQWVAISSLGKIGGGSALAVKTLVSLIQETEQPLLREDALASLSKIAPQHPMAIQALVQLMQSTDDEAARRQAAESLGKIDPGNLEAIAALTEMLQRSQDEFTRRQAAASLGKIAPGHPEALASLTRLMGDTTNQDVRQLAVETIGEIGQNNTAALESLMRLLQSESEPKIRKQALKSLGRLGLSHPRAIALLVQLTCTEAEETTRLQAAESLIALLKTPSQMARAISYLSEYNSQPYLAVQKILWHCSQQLPYPDFYRAWHSSPPPLLFDDPQPSALTTLQQLRSAISEHPQLRGQITPIYIDSHEFLDPDVPLIDIYDQMLNQHCPPFAYGLPDTLPKLKLYWHSFCRQQAPKKPILIFWENSIALPENILKAVAKFKSPIIAVLNSPVDYLPSFYNQDPSLMPLLLQWLSDHLAKKA